MDSNWGLEFHDSEVLGFRWIGPQFVLHMKCYMHASPGRPGIDPGKGFIQEARFVFDDGEFQGEVKVWPADILEGNLTSALSPQPVGFLDLPFRPVSHPKLDLVLGGFGEELTISGSQLTIQWIGAPQYVEEFEGSGSSRRGWN